MSYQSEKRRIDRQHHAREAAARADAIRQAPERSTKAWAWELRRRERAGEALSSQQRKQWRDALERELLSLPPEERS